MIQDDNESDPDFDIDDNPPASSESEKDEKEEEDDEEEDLDQLTELGQKIVYITSYGWKYGPPKNCLQNYNIKKLPNPSLSIRKRKTGKCTGRLRSHRVVRY
jgi:hypothetical protein